MSSSYTNIWKKFKLDNVKFDAVGIFHCYILPLIILLWCIGFSLQKLYITEAWEAIKFVFGQNVDREMICKRDVCKIGESSTINLCAVKLAKVLQKIILRPVLI